MKALIFVGCCVGVLACWIVFFVGIALLETYLFKGAFVSLVVLGVAVGLPACILYEAMKDRYFR